MKNKWIALVLSLITILILVPSVSFADVSDVDDTDPGLDDIFDVITTSSSTASTSSTVSSSSVTSIDSTDPTTPDDSSSGATESSTPSSSSQTDGSSDTESTSAVSSSSTSIDSTDPTMPDNFPTANTTANTTPDDITQPTASTKQNVENSTAVSVPTSSTSGQTALTLSAYFVKVNSVKLSWNVVKNATEYKIYRAIGKKGSLKLYESVKTNSYTDLKLKRGKNYQYKVCAVLSGKTVDCSQTVSIVTLAKKVKVVKKKVTSKFIQFKFKNTLGAEGFEIKYSTNKKLKGAKKITIKKIVKLRKLKKLKSDTKYYVRIRAFKIINGKKVYTKDKRFIVTTK